MKLKTILIVALGFVTVGAGIFQYVHQEKAAKRWYAWQQAWKPALQVQPKEVRAWFWQPVVAKQVSIEPSGVFHAALGVPFGYQATVEKVEVVDYQGIDFEPEAERGKLRFGGLSIKTLNLKIHPALPSFADLGYDTLEGEGEWQWTYRNNNLHAWGVVNFAQAGTLRLDCRLDSSPAVFRLSFNDTAFNRCEAVWQDAGLWVKIKDGLAAGNKLSLPEWQEQSEAWLNQQVLLQSNPNNLAALAGFLRSNTTLKVGIDPANPMTLDKLKLYQPSQYAAVLGLEISSE
jgi:hypothetical protein